MLKLNLNFFKDLFIGTIIFLVSLVSAIIISNGICKFLENFKVPLLILLLIHLFIIIGCLYILRYYLAQIIKDKELFNSINMLGGPTLGAVSFYFSPVIKSISQDLFK